ncbi:helix-turn-helix domain-containing protein [Coralloluteibacterium thermophilus]|uniref:Helix-turn-helix domain-containing protein n=1 Tax=Coralloluteibacterium thermophilum TaxID=2707049 RepID=A0ABV9NJX7_9GAMM
MSNEHQTEPLGLRLRRAREARGLSVEDASRQLHLPRRVIDLIDRSEWASLPGGIHLRGQLMSYARLVGVPREEVDAVAAARPPEPPPLVTMSQTSRFRRTLDRSARNLVYVAITVVLALPVWLGTREHLSSRDAALTPLDQTPAELQSAATGTPSVVTPVVQPPLLASLTPYQRSAPVPVQDAPDEAEPGAAEAAPADAPVAAPADGLVLRANGESWFEVVGHDGQRIEQGILRPGVSRSFPSREVARVTLGNAPEVEVLNGGRPVDTTPYRRAQVARFNMSADGVVAPPNG